MGRIFRIDSPFTDMMSKLFDLILLNILFLICCVPVITIGASCTALHTVTMKIAAGDDSPVLKKFFQAFCSNFRQATISWFLLVLAGVLLYVDSAISTQLGTGGTIIKCILGFFEILYLFVMLYIFPIQCRYHNTIRRSLQNALLMAIRQLPKTILLSSTILLPFFLALYGPTSVFLISLVTFLVIGCSLIACIQDRIIIKIFNYYDELVEEDTADNSGPED